MFNRLYNNQSRDYRGLLLVLVVILTALFLFFQSSLLGQLLPDVRSHSWDRFTLRTVANKEIEVQDYWQTREKYNSGYFQFDKQGIHKTDLQTQLNKMDILIKPSISFHAFLLYHSDNWQSIEALVTTKELKDIVQIEKRYNNHFFNQTTQLIYEDNIARKAIIVFIKPVSEMQRAVGFLDYRQWDKELVKDKYWLSISHVSY